MQQVRTRPAPGSAAARAAIRAAPSAPVAQTARTQVPRTGTARTETDRTEKDRTRTSETARARTRAAPQRSTAVPWYERAQRLPAAPGQRHCGHLERILHREWAADELPPPQVVLAVDRLAEFPQLIKERLVAGLDAIYVGPGGVPDLDDMGSLSGMPLPSGRATWDVCAGAYGERKVIVGSRPSPTPDVMCHEIGHALDDIDGVGRLLAVGFRRVRLALRTVPALDEQRLSPPARSSGPAGVLR